MAATFHSTDGYLERQLVTWVVDKRPGVTQVTPTLDCNKTNSPLEGEQPLIGTVPNAVIKAYYISPVGSCKPFYT